MSARGGHRGLLAMLRGTAGEPASAEALAAFEARTAARLQEEFAASAERQRKFEEELLKNQIRVQWRVLDQIAAGAGADAVLACEICGFSGAPDAFGFRESHCKFGGGRLARHQCPACDTIFGPRKMLDLRPQELSQEYEMHYRVYPEGDSTREEIRAFHALEPERGKRYLNFGAGAWSHSVAELRSQGWEVYAYEPHDAATRGDHVVKSEEHLATLTFHGIFSNNVLEHFRHPVAELRKMQSLLLPGGRMSHATPCFDYLYEYTRFHLFFFPGRSLAALAAAADLNVDRFTVDGEFMNAVLSGKN